MLKRFSEVFIAKKCNFLETRTDVFANLCSTYYHATEIGENIRFSLLARRYESVFNFTNPLTRESERKVIKNARRRL